MHYWRVGGFLFRSWLLSHRSAAMALVAVLSHERSILAYQDSLELR